MVMIGVLIVLIVNECSSGDDWFRRLSLGLCAAAGLIWAASVSPARTFVLCLMALCAVTAAELDRISRRRSEAIKTLKMLDERDEERRAGRARRRVRLANTAANKRAA